ncbi:hypothetical protein KALB_3755 [Kutzneria albida DSM 43870]|uniref:Glycoside hydrolase family 5 domain-containing protein n=2 Tax=Kutzneria TaxID=43356 RepID=W5WG49_9PSEU|nr:hypothetical protein KALB_3755 [Kutzneria albida DSM 43870]
MPPMSRSARPRATALLAVLALAATTATQCAGPEPLGWTRETGGSNYDFYGLAGRCDREGFGVINGFARGRDTITAQLAQMYRAGQRRLRIGVFHHRGPDTGTIMDSTGGDLSPANRRNLADLLAAVRAAGFAEVEVAMQPSDENHPDWSHWREDLYQENWNLVANLRPVIAAAGIPYRIDLLNEGSPMSTEPALRRYAQRLWQDYTANFGKADTVGFSMTVWIADRATQLAAVYGDNPPEVFDVHLYGDAHNGDERTQFVDADRKMRELGYTQDWIIGEAYFDDRTAARGIAQAIAQTGRTVRYLAQWPLTRARSCADVDVAAPIAFEAYGRLPR